MEIENYIILTDQQLVTLVLDGDSAAFEALFNRYKDAIYKFCFQRTGGNSDDANDLLQETFIKAFLNLEKYDVRYTFGQWIYVIARNVFIDFIRKRRDECSIDTLPSSNGFRTPIAPEASPEESIIDRQKRSQLTDYLERMTPCYRRFIELRFFKELSYEEIAAELNMPLGTVKTQIHRAREQLCKFIVQGDML